VKIPTARNIVWVMMDWLDGQNLDRVAKNKAGQSDTEEVTLKAVLVRWPAISNCRIKANVL
jgi:hypothetical protein